MQGYFPAPERRYPSPSAQRRSGEHWKARLGVVLVVTLTLCTAGVMFRLAGLGVGAATSPFRAPAAGAPPRPAGAPTAADPAVQPPGSQPAASQPTAAPAAQPTQPPATPVPPTPQPAATARPGQREHTVQSGDTLFALASRYNTTVEALVAANNLRSRDATLAVGQKLIIPGP